MVISGHDHIVSRLETINGTHQLISGAGGHASAGFLPGYVVIGHKNSSKELDYSLITINPSTKLKTQLGPFDL